jgi:hypothetical protein
MAAARKAAAEEPEPQVEETVEKRDAVQQPKFASDKHGRLHPDVVKAAREDAGIAPQERLIEHTASGVIKGS